ncbi:hypothetical protein CRG98_036428 [Punica granatum]|uniref:Uncharacterized protein n=1 Tax=Punica granatum TaxID=22663 RepID=A0A2I0IHJ4_PUNGR|nr:hypothetical protein CRG98_036428 [Punica granatum]
MVHGDEITSSLHKALKFTVAPNLTRSQNRRTNSSVAEAVQSVTVFRVGVLSVGDGVADDVLQEDLQDPAGLLVDEAADSLDASTAGETSVGWLLRS